MTISQNDLSYFKIFPSCDIDSGEKSVCEYGFTDNSIYLYGQSCEIKVIIQKQENIEFVPSFKDLEELTQGSEFTVIYCNNSKIKIDYPGDFQFFRSVQDAWDYLSEIFIDENFFMLIPKNNYISNSIWHIAYYAKDKERKDIKKALTDIRDKFKIAIPKLTSDTKTLRKHLEKIAECVNN